MTAGESDSAFASEAPGQPSLAVQALELAVFLFLIVPSLVLSLFAFRYGKLSFVLVATSTICRDLALVSLILFFLWRNGEPVWRIGWTVSRLVRELVIGVLCFIPFVLVAMSLELVLLRLGFSVPSRMPSFMEVQGGGEVPLGVLLVMVVAFSEETIFRGYLLLRFPVILRNWPAAILLSALIFATGHGYEGSLGLVTVGCMGLLLALVYLWRGSLVAPMVIHFLQDLLVIVILPLIMRR